MDLTDLSFSSIFAGFAFGTFGFYIARLGWKQSNPWHLLTGVILMFYPYFVSGAWLTWGIGCVLMYVAYVKR
jgi:hypothetical protein